MLRVVNRGRGHSMPPFTTWGRCSIVCSTSRADLTILNVALSSRFLRTCAWIARDVRLSDPEGAENMCARFQTRSHAPKSWSRPCLSAGRHNPCTTRCHNSARPGFGRSVAQEQAVGIDVADVLSQGPRRGSTRGQVAARGRQVSTYEISTRQASVAQTTALRQVRDLAERLLAHPRGYRRLLDRP